MKKSIIVLSLVLWVFAAHNLHAQEGCAVSIAPSTVPLSNDFLSKRQTCRDGRNRLPARFYVHFLQNSESKKRLSVRFCTIIVL
ncbi:MAG: hypothetical protein LBK03_05770 [Bacteroidales bacterium]|jgi:hypothetical protein|nr:hypothetical protein [Bacteroidales bacterium]